MEMSTEQPHKDTVTRTQFPPPSPKWWQRISLTTLLLLMWLLIIVKGVFDTASNVRNIPYSEFQQLLGNGRVQAVKIFEDRIEGEYLEGDVGNDARSSPVREGGGNSSVEVSGKTQRFITTRVDPQLSESLNKAKIKYEAIRPNTALQSLASWTVPTLLFFGLWYLLLRIAAKGGAGGGFGGGLGGGGLFSFGKSRAKIYAEKETKTTLADVAGVDEAKEELKEIINFLKAPKDYGRLGGRLPKGVLLVGPPGTGKTLLARAVAGEAGVPFYSISGSEFVELFVGVGAARVRDLFEQARGHAPCIIFIDELDALGRARGLGVFGGGHDEKEQTLNQLLAELDGFDSSVGVVILAATNRPEILDPALLRAGRFDRQILVDRPDKRGRVEILQVHLKKIAIKADLDIEQIAALTPGFTGADLANLVNEAALLATRRGADLVEINDFTSAIERIVAGLEKKNRLLNPRERRIVAFHEVGHALVAMGLSHVDPVIKVSIIPRGVSALGYTIQRPLEDRFLMSKEELIEKLTVLMGGRAAEQLIFGEISTGSSDDLSRATEIARAMVTRYGMGDGLRLMAYEDEPSQFLQPSGGIFSNHETQYLSQESAAAIDHAVGEIVSQAFQRALELLRVNLDNLTRVAELLLAKETLLKEEIVAVMEGTLHQSI